MRKIFVAAAAVSLMLSTAALAAEYDTDENKVSGIDASSYKTVLIIKDGSQSIDDAVYVNQAASGSALSAEAQFLLKADPADGIYTLKLGGGESGTKTSKFYIGMPITDADEQCDVKFVEEGEGDTSSVSFGWEAVNPHGFSTLILKLEDKVYGHALEGYIDGEMALGFVISEIPSTVTDIDAYFSATDMDSLTKKGDSGE